MCVCVYTYIDTLKRICECICIYVVCRYVSIYSVVGQEPWQIVLLCKIITDLK